MLHTTVRIAALALQSRPAIRLSLQKRKWVWLGRARKTGARLSGAGEETVPNAADPRPRIKGQRKRPAYVSGHPLLWTRRSGVWVHFGGLLLRLRSCVRRECTRLHQDPSACVFVSDGTGSAGAAATGFAGGASALKRVAIFRKSRRLNRFLDAPKCKMYRPFSVLMK